MIGTGPFMFPATAWFPAIVPAALPAVAKLGKSGAFKGSFAAKSSGVGTELIAVLGNAPIAPGAAGPKGWAAGGSTTLPTGISGSGVVPVKLKSLEPEAGGLEPEGEDESCMCLLYIMEEGLAR